MKLLPYLSAEFKNNVPDEISRPAFAEFTALRANANPRRGFDTADDMGLGIPLPAQLRKIAFDLLSAADALDTP